MRLKSFFTAKQTINETKGQPSRWKKALVAQSCPTLCDPVDCSPPGSSVHGISQVRILERTATSFSRGSSQPKSNLALPYCRQALYCLRHSEKIFANDVTDKGLIPKNI